MIAAFPRRRILIVGGGISGLAAAQRLNELNVDAEISLVEADGRLGGVLETVIQDGYLIERGADNFITNMPWGLDLCRRLNLEDDLQETSREHRTAFVVRRGRLLKIPEGFVIMAPSRVWPVIATPILSPWGKLRMAGEYLLPRRRESGDESLASFVTRRFGRETYERLVQPLIGGIYTGDPSRLSVAATMPRFVQMEQQYGSLIRAVWAQRKQSGGGQQGGGARYSLFVALRGGMQRLIDALAGRLPAGSVSLRTRVTGLARQPDGRWQATIAEASSPAPPADSAAGLASTSSGERTSLFDAVILATKANAASRLLAPVDGELGQLLGGIPHASCSIVALGYDRSQIPHRLDGFGYVVPQAERRQTISGSFSSVKYPGRAPDGRVLVRVFIGGECQPELAALPDNELIRIARQDLAELLGARGEPHLTLVSRYEETMPQYHVGHGDRVREIDERTARWPGLYLAGNAFGGVGLPLCIHRAEQSAERVARQLAGENKTETVASG